ncbi:MAG: ABC transporter permease [Stackebrandtia sp.]
MMWLTWRQHRAAALYTLIGLVVLAAAVIPTGLMIRADFAELGLADCVYEAGNKVFMAADFPQDCQTSINQMSKRYSAMGFGIVLLAAIPLLIGLFWGAPLVSREIENGTQRLVWTQGVSRRHWALVKFGIVGSLVVVASVIYGLLLSWWMEPLSSIGVLGRFTSLFFDVQGLAPVGYTLFAVAVGVFAGSFGRKTVTAMGISVAAFVAVRIGIAGFARPNFMAAEILRTPLDGPSREINFTQQNWEFAVNVRDADGNIVAANSAMGCEKGDDGCGFGAGAYNSTDYQPGDRFWSFQFIETGIFVALAGVLLYLAVRRVRRLS